MTLGEKIYQQRKEKGLSQEELATSLAVSRQAISKWELGESVPDTGNVVQLSKLFSVSADYLLKEEYKSDVDIPAVQHTNTRMKVEHGRKNKLLASCLILFGLVGMIILLILSSVIPAWRTVSFYGYPPIGVDEVGNVLSGEEQALSLDEPVRIWTTVRSQGHLGAFLQTYHLTWLFILCVISMLIGAVILLQAREGGKARIFWVVGALMALIISFFLSRYTFFTLHGNTQWLIFLFVVSLIVLGIAAVIDSRKIMLSTVIAYIGGFALGLLLGTDGLDPGGGATNNWWQIWTISFLIIIIVGVVWEIISRRKP